MGEKDDQWLGKRLSSSWTAPRIYIVTTVVLLVAVVLGVTQLVPLEAAISTGGAAVLVHMSVSFSSPCNATSGRTPTKDGDDMEPLDDYEGPSGPAAARADRH